MKLKRYNNFINESLLDDLKVSFKDKEYKKLGVTKSRLEKLSKEELEDINKWVEEYNDFEAPTSIVNLADRVHHVLLNKTMADIFDKEEWNKTTGNFFGLFSYSGEESYGKKYKDYSKSIIFKSFRDKFNIKGGAVSDVLYQYFKDIIRYRDFDNSVISNNLNKLSKSNNVQEFLDILYTLKHDLKRIESIHQYLKYNYTGYKSLKTIDKQMKTVKKFNL